NDSSELSHIYLVFVLRPEYDSRQRHRVPDFSRCLYARQACQLDVEHYKLRLILLNERYCSLTVVGRKHRSGFSELLCDQRSQVVTLALSIACKNNAHINSTLEKCFARWLLL